MPNTISKYCPTTGKVVFASRELAEQSHQYLNRFAGKQGHSVLTGVYKCKGCNGFHLSSSTEPANSNEGNKKKKHYKNPKRGPKPEQ